MIVSLDTRGSPGRIMIFQKTFDKPLIKNQIKVLLK